MVRQEEPDDYVIASGETYSVQDFLEEACSHVGLDWGKYVEIDPWYYSLHRVSLLSLWQPECLPRARTPLLFLQF